MKLKRTVNSGKTNPMFSQLFFTCKNTTLGVEEAASPVVAFKCK